MKEASETAERLGDYPVEAIHSSDLCRARQTADVLLRRTHTHRVTATKELRPWNPGVFCGQRVTDILPFLNLLNQDPDLVAPSGESFYQFYGRYSRRLTDLMNRASESQGCIVAFTHVRNVLASQTIIEHGDRDRVPVRGGPPTGTLIVVEKQDGVRQMRADHGKPAIITQHIVTPAIPLSRVAQERCVHNVLSIDANSCCPRRVARSCGVASTFRP
jgi:broad specificity phosphatase PhoE